ncbi:MAG: hypothetical protein C5B57_10490 [Blastocatellia bacterium]|nr:MAG: hypothetical protein C5B57_10490 [Blastocatellia bacterium]
MFDLITDNRERPLRERSLPSKIVAMVLHVVIVTLVVVIPLLTVTNQLPRVVPTMLAFVAAEPVALPPPPPPPPAPATPAAARPVEAVRTTGQFAAPLDAPSEIVAERAPVASTGAVGVLGGVEGGVPGGVVGGVLGGLVASAAPPPPPPPPPPVAPGPVRIGGQITVPALLKRVEPEYPDVAAQAHLTGLVILEATVSADGCVETVKVLRSRHPLLDRASEQALMQWRYSPLVLNGVARPFILTVTFTFSVK